MLHIIKDLHQSETFFAEKWCCTSFVARVNRSGFNMYFLGYRHQHAIFPIVVLLR